MEKIENSFLILQIITTFVLMAGLILVIVQACLNIPFNFNTNKKIIAEKLLYEQFSYEIYSNINSPRIILKNSKEKVEGSVPFEAKLDRYFDCEGLYKNKINNCRNKIISYSTCCDERCCVETKGHQKERCYDYSFNESKDFYIGREEKHKGKEDCVPFSIKNTEFKSIKINDQYYYANYFESFNYSYYLSNERINFKNGECKGDYNQIGILDNYYKNPLCMKKEESFYRNEKIKVKLILSFDTPYVHEWNNFIVKSTVKCDFNKTSKDWEEIDERKKINYKNINDALESFGIEGKSNSGDYQEVNHSSVEGLESYSDYKILKNENIKLYSTPYIGFKNDKELEKFRKYFIPNDNKNNSLYRISDLILFPYIASIICNFIIIVLLIIFIVFAFNFYSVFIDHQRFYFITKIIRSSLIVIYSVIYLYIYLVRNKKKYENINIEMQEEYKKVLTMYEKRKRLVFFNIGIAFILLAFLIEIVTWILYPFTRNKKIQPMSDQQENTGERIDRTANNGDQPEDGSLTLRINPNSREDLIPNTITIYFQREKEDSKIKIEGVEPNDKLIDIMKNKAVKLKAEWGSLNFIYFINNLKDELDISKSVSELKIKNNDIIRLKEIFRINFYWEKKNEKIVVNIDKNSLLNEIIESTNKDWTKLNVKFYLQRNNEKLERNKRISELGIINGDTILIRQ